MGCNSLASMCTLATRPVKTRDAISSSKRAVRSCFRAWGFRGTARSHIIEAAKHAFVYRAWAVLFVWRIWTWEYKLGCYFGCLVLSTPGGDSSSYNNKSIFHPKTSFQRPRAVVPREPPSTACSALIVVWKTKCRLVSHSPTSCTTAPFVETTRPSINRIAK